jgi:hypothetical protein
VVKAIETIYKGYRFRSRLEARWAIFLDTVGEPWEYEKEGYDLKGVYYLPDFYLPRLGCFIEVKGEAPSVEELAKAEMLRDEVGKAIAVFSGIPGEWWGILYCWDLSDSSGGSSDWQVALCDGEPQGIAFGVKTLGRERTLFAAQEFERPLLIGEGPLLPRVRIARATEAAKSARFEHGEKGVR